MSTKPINPDPQNWLGQDGRRVKTAHFSNGDQLGCERYENLVCRYWYMGDRDEAWILAFVDGKEVARHNCKHLESIEWLTEDDNA